MGYYRLDHITNAEIQEKARTDIHSIPGYTNGINYKELALARPYMFSDKIIHVTFSTKDWMINQIIDWFGKEIEIQKKEQGLQISLKTSTESMEYWAMQYANFVEVLAPESLRKKIKNNLRNAIQKYEE